jgi:hypothetical protein
MVKAMVMQRTPPQKKSVRLVIEPPERGVRFENFPGENFARLYTTASQSLQEKS